MSKFKAWESISFSHMTAGVKLQPTVVASVAGRKRIDLLRPIGRDLTRSASALEDVAFDQNPTLPLLCVRRGQFVTRQ